MTALRLELVPMAAPRLSRRDAWAPSPAAARYFAYRAELCILAKQAGYVPGDALSIIFYLPMPASWSQRKRRLMDGQPHQQKPDTDNLLKGFCDALLADDAHVWDMHARKRWAVVGAIEIEMVDAERNAA